MTIIKAKNSVETYRAKARAKEINELTGRTNRPDLTKYVISQISQNIPIKKDTILVDIGCGDGSFLVKCAEKGISIKLVGVLPTKQEVTRVSDYIFQSKKKNNHLISIKLGLAEKTNLPSNYCDTLICNSVLQASGQTTNLVKLALKEFCRVTKNNGTIFIGELPDSDELIGKNYGDSIKGWLSWILKNKGLKVFLSSFKDVMKALISKEPFVIVPKTMFFMKPTDFISLLNDYGIKIIKYYKHKEIDEQGNEYESKTRWNYICTKISN